MIGYELRADGGLVSRASPRSWWTISQRCLGTGEQHAMD